MNWFFLCSVIKLDMFLDKVVYNDAGSNDFNVYRLCLHSIVYESLFFGATMVHGEHH